MRGSENKRRDLGTLRRENLLSLVAAGSRREGEGVVNRASFSESWLGSEHAVAPIGGDGEHCRRKRSGSRSEGKWVWFRTSLGRDDIAFFNFPQYCENFPGHDLFTLHYS